MCLCCVCAQVRLGRLGQGSFFGERSIMARGNGWRNGVRSRTAVSRNACRFPVLHKRTVDTIRQQIPALHKHMLEVEKVRACACACACACAWRTHATRNVRSS